MSSRNYWSLTLRGLLVMILAFATSIGYAQKIFVGTIEYSVNVKGDMAEMMRSAFPTKMVVISDGKNTKTTLDGMMPQEVLSIGSDKYIIDNSSKVAKKILVDQVDAKSKPAITKTKRTLKILGYEVQEFVLTTKDAEGTTSNAYAYVHSGVELPNGGATTSMIALPKELNGMMLKMMLSLPVTDTQIIDLELVATKVTPNNVKADSIKLPLGYKIEDQKLDVGR